VFRDPGFARQEAENLEIRSDPMTRLTRVIDDRGLTQAQAAALRGVTQPKVSDRVRGKIDRFSIDMLAAMLGQARVRVQFIVGRGERWRDYSSPPPLDRRDEGPGGHEGVGRGMRHLTEPQPSRARRSFE
jgi:predicted XRE-type DNA-binding protein